MDDLPVCKYRGEKIAEDRYICTSPFITASKAVVTSNVCNNCLYVDRDLNTPPKPPNLLRKAMNFAKASAKYIISGRKNVDDTTYRKRIELCMACDEYFKDNQCTHQSCGCKIAGGIIAKARWESEKCPIDKW